MPYLTVQNLTKKFNDIVAVDNVSFEVEENEFITLLGPSGCGKTTTLRCIAGLEDPDEGEIIIDGNVVFSSEKVINIPVEKRNIGMVFQSYAIWPHLTVYENVEFGLKIKKFPKKEIKTKVLGVLKLVQLENLHDRYPSQLSGGQQQRVAVARSLAINPELLLFDEPLSNLDAKLRENMRIELLDIQRRIHLSSVYVTHDQAEAMVISDRIIAMNQGKIIQISKPKELYNFPNSKFVAEFIGKTNFLNGEVIKTPSNQKDHFVIKTEIGQLSINRFPYPQVETSKKILVAIRPEKIKIFDRQPEKRNEKVNLFKGTIIRNIFLGDRTQLMIMCEDIMMEVLTNTDQNYRERSEIYLELPPNDCIVLPF